MTTIKLKNGSGAPTAGDLAQGEPALDLTNKRLYTEDSGGTVIEVGTNPGVDVTFADDRKAIFGDGSDLQIYHDGSNSYISEVGTGELVIQARDAVTIEDGTSGDNYVYMQRGNKVSLFYAGAEKLATTSTGIDVTGDVVSDGATIAGTLELNSNNFTHTALTPNYNMVESDVTGENTQLIQSAGLFRIRTVDDSLANPVERFRIDHSTGDVSFFGSVAGQRSLHWDSSADALGIGTVSPSTALEVVGTVTADGLTVTGSNGNFEVATTGNSVNMTRAGNNFITASDSSGDLYLGAGGTSFIKIDNGGDISFYEDTGTTAKLFWDASAESLGLGTSSPVTLLNTKGATLTATTDKREILIEAHGDGVNNSQGALTGITFRNSPTTYTAGSFNRTSGVYGLNEDSAGYGRSMGLAFYTATNDATATEAMRIDSSGNLLVGTTSTSASVAGGRIFSTGRLVTSVDDEGHYFRRNNSDGTIVEFAKDGSTVGSIGTNSSRLTIGNGDTGLLIAGDLDNITPFNTSTNASRDAAVDLGNSGVRFKDLYLSGKVNANGVTTTATAWQSTSNSTSSSKHMVFTNPNGNVGDIRTNGSATAYITSSDYRLKENVVDMSGATERLKQLKPSRFNFIADPDTTVDGFLAHEVADVVPEAIAGEKDAMQDEEYEVTPAVLDDDGNVVTEAVMGTRSVPDYQGIDQSKLVPLLVATIQELEARIAALESN